MAEHRAFSVGVDGHFIGFEPLVCDADDIAKAKRLIDGHDVGLWCGERLVVRLKATTKIELNNSGCPRSTLWKARPRR